MKTSSVIVLLGVFVLLISWKQNQPSTTSNAEIGKVKVMILYPNGEDKTFDMKYYSEKHMPMVAELFGEPLQSYTIDKGLSGRTPDEPATYIAIGTFYFEKLSDYKAAFGANAEKIRSDIPNYTNIKPIVQISEIVK